MLLSNEPDGTRQIDLLRAFGEAGGAGVAQPGPGFAGGSITTSGLLSDRAAGPISSFRSGSPMAKPQFERLLGQNYGMEEGAEPMRGGIVPFRFAGQSDGPSSMSFSVSLADVLKYSTDQDVKRLKAGATPMGLGGEGRTRGL